MEFQATEKEEMTKQLALNPSLIPTEQVTKRFFQRLKPEYTFLCSQIMGIPDPFERQSYAAVLLKRLLILCFLQQAGLLLDNPDYLSQLLAMTQKYQSKQTFYRSSLRPLFRQIEQESLYAHRQLPSELARSLFQTHALEMSHPEIELPDEVFQRLFSFFKGYQWRLDAHPSYSLHELHPNLLASLVEQQVEPRQLGTYYTNDDVSTYIVYNTLIPALFQAVSELDSESTQPAAPLWVPLRQQPERFIQPALRTTNYLPEETERDYKTRHRRYAELYRLLQTGSSGCIDDLITYNLDLLHFTQTVIQSCQSPTPLLHFLTALEALTVLDPTCGSGAFLFTALQVLEQLYSTCLTQLADVFARLHPVEQQAYHQAYRYIQLAEQPERQTFILHSIISRNLYGVELTEEATTICILRLYLALLASTEEGSASRKPVSMQHHILIGNTLIGETGLAPGKTEHEQSFHWARAFPHVVERGGFAVIIGNPPYVEYSKVRQDYRMADYAQSGNLYAAILERSLALCRADHSYLGLIVPLSLCGSPRFEPLRQQLIQASGRLWLANFEIFPCRLFERAYQRLSICLIRHDRNQPCRLAVTRIYRWYTAERPHLLQLLSYHTISSPPTSRLFPKLAAPLQETILQKVWQKAAEARLATQLLTQKSDHFVYYQEATNYWIKAVCHIPFYTKNGITMVPPHGRFLYLKDTLTAQCVMALMNSSLFYIWFATYSDGFHLAHRLVKDFPADPTLLAHPALAQLARRVEANIQSTASMSTRNTRSVARHGTAKKVLAIELSIELAEYHMGNTKGLLDQIDTILAQHYNFTEEELAFILHYDLKYRMGKESTSQLHS